jgi:hypothetical protein
MAFESFGVACYYYWKKSKNVTLECATIALLQETKLSNITSFNSVSFMPHCQGFFLKLFLSFYLEFLSKVGEGCMI